MMAITRTDAHRKKMIEEAAEGVLNLQIAVARNAETNRQIAVEQSMSLVDLQQRINNQIASYDSIRAKLRHFRDVTIPADAGFTLVGDQLLLTLQSVGGVGTAVADHLDIYAAMPRTTYAEITSGCDYLISNVTQAESIWD